MLRMPELLSRTRKVAVAVGASAVILLLVLEDRITPVVGAWTRAGTRTGDDVLRLGVGLVLCATLLVARQRVFAALVGVGILVNVAIRIIHA